MTGLSVAFNDGSLVVSPTWTSLTDMPYQLLSSWSIDRGRASELEKTKTGTLTATLIDRTGVLDPTNTSGPFFGKLDPMRQVKFDLHDPVNNTDTTMFRGFISDWQYAFDVSEQFNVLTLECADAFDLFAACELTPGQHGDSTGLSDFADVWFAGTPSNVPGVAAVSKHVDVRIAAILDAIGWPGTGLTTSTLRSIFSGNVTVQGTVYARRDQALTALFDAADAEFPGVSNIYMSKSGAVNFRGRFARFNPTNPTYGINFWKAGDDRKANADGRYAPITDLVPRRSKDDLINACIALPQGVSETDVPGQLFKDTTSINTYGFRSLSFDNLITYQGHDDLGATTSALTEMTKFATYYVNNRKSPQTRVQTVSFRTRPGGLGAAKIWALVAGVEIGDVVTLVTLGHPGGGGFNADYFVDGIRVSGEPLTATQWDVTCELDLSPRAWYSSNPFGTLDSGG